MAELSRYDRSKFLHFSTEINDYDVFVDDLIESLRALPKTHTYLVTGAEAGRLDLVSYLLYGRTDLWWLIMVYNDIFDPFDFSDKTALFAPSIQELEYWYYENSSRILSI